MQAVADALNNAIALTQARLKLAEEDAKAPIRPGGWSRKQVIGHLIDSASNNHQRFVRLMLEDGLSLPGYLQDGWVASQRYNERPWLELLLLWSAYNRHLASIIANVPQSALSHKCSIAGNAPVTLEFLMRDYLDHLEHHFKSL
jgi:hypothetical protein